MQNRLGHGFGERVGINPKPQNLTAQPFFTAVRNSFTYPIFISLSKTFCLHFCGAWVYRQSDRRRETHADKETAPTGVQRYVEERLTQ